MSSTYVLELELIAFAYDRLKIENEGYADSQVFGLCTYMVVGEEQIFGGKKKQVLLDVWETSKWRCKVDSM